MGGAHPARRWRGDRAVTRPILIGITGNIACGKSLVTSVLAAEGVEIIDGDRVYADMVQPGMPLLRAIGEEFGPEMIQPDGTLDRRKLGGLVFSDPAALARLDDVVRPFIGAEMLRRANLSMASAVALDAVKLFESNIAAACDENWVVTCTPEQQLARLMARNGLDRDAAILRIAAQNPVAEKVARADVVIDNSGSIEQTTAQVRAAYRTLRNRIHSVDDRSLQ